MRLRFDVVGHGDESDGIEEARPDELRGKVDDTQRDPHHHEDPKRHLSQPVALRIPAADSSDARRKGVFDGTGPEELSRLHEDVADVVDQQDHRAGPDEVCPDRVADQTDRRHVMHRHLIEVLPLQIPDVKRGDGLQVEGQLKTVLEQQGVGDGILTGDAVAVVPEPSRLGEPRLT